MAAPANESPERFTGWRHEDRTGNPAMSHPESLDQAYLDFSAGTGPVFERYPQMESLRHFIFKELLAQCAGAGWKDSVKHWLRPFLRRARTDGDLVPADVVILIESRREVIVDALLPVYRELISRGLKVRIVSLSGPEQLPESAIHLRFQARSVAPAWAKPAWKDLCDAVEGLRSESLKRSFYYASARIGGLLDEAARILQALKPRVVLIASTQLAGGSAFAVTARSLGAVTLLLQHGILQPFYVPLLADKMLTWGESSNDILLHLGICNERLVALGSPRHDSMVPAASGLARTELLRALSVPERPTFVFFSNGNDLVRNGSAPEECAKWLEETAAAHSQDVNIIVRLHPNEDGSMYRRCRHLITTKGSPDLAVLLDGCDWVGSLCSTVLYDALLFEKPVWQFYADGWPELADNWRSGFATRVRSQADFSEMVGKVVREGSGVVNDGLFTGVFANHGQATEAVADFVEQQLNGRGMPLAMLPLGHQSKPLHAGEV
jgi:hypothetical protein